MWYLVAAQLVFAVSIHSEVEMSLGDLFGQADRLNAQEPCVGWILNLDRQAGKISQLAPFRITSSWNRIYYIFMLPLCRYCLSGLIQFSSFYLMFSDPT